MHAIAMGRLLRMLRLRRNWRQSDVAAKAGISSSGVGRHENGVIGSLESLERHAALLGMRIDVRLVGRAGASIRMADEEHARIVEILAGWFRARGFLTETEASFSEWGERGRIDLLAFEPVSATLAVVEVKTLLLDLQDLFGGLNVKERLASTLAERRGWRAARLVTILAVASTAGNRQIVRIHPSLFADFVVSRLAANALLGHRRILHWVSAGRAGPWLAGRQRVRRSPLNPRHAGRTSPPTPPQWPVRG